MSRLVDELAPIEGIGTATARAALANGRFNDNCYAMTQLLERAFVAASRLSDAEQDAVASLLLAELETERHWREAFAASQDELVKLADEALREFDAGETRPMDLQSDFPND